MTKFICYHSEKHWKGILYEANSAKEAMEQFVEGDIPFEGVHTYVWQVEKQDYNGEWIPMNETVFEPVFEFTGYVQVRYEEVKND